jgi:hypothetical protein
LIVPLSRGIYFGSDEGNSCLNCRRKEEAVRLNGAGIFKNFMGAIGTEEE